ncbi:MAG: hypothetical protein P1S60_17405, partial [Anaerolineae bacterium]|nr:hypothetical protein [Anaerolineae bacterium]
DRAYSPIDLESVLRHELVHRLDPEIGCQDAPALFREGLAVYLAGGHYRREPVIRKAATALSNGYSIPFKPLITDFYGQQHEIGYLQAAAFMAFINAEFGWEGIEALCQSSSEYQGTDQEKLDSAAQFIVKEDFTGLVDQFRTWLHEQPLLPEDSGLFEYELRLMELMRLYQRQYDPAAHFLEGVLFNPKDGEQRDIVADFIRRPRTDHAIAIELILTAGQQALIRRDLPFLKTIIQLLEVVLVEGNLQLREFVEIVDLVQYIKKIGYEPYNLVIRGNGTYEVAIVHLVRWPETNTIRLAKLGNRWIVTGSNR